MQFPARMVPSRSRACLLENTLSQPGKNNTHPKVRMLLSAEAKTKRLTLRSKYCRINRKLEKRRLIPRGESGTWLDVSQPARSFHGGGNSDGQGVCRRISNNHARFRLSDNCPHMVAASN